MSPRGRIPKPTRLKVISGNPGKRRLNSDEPVVPSRRAICPSWLPPEAKKFWRALARKLRAAGMETPHDSDAMTVYAALQRRWQEAEQFIAENGSTYPIRDDEGRIKYVGQFPQVSIARNLAQILRCYQQEFGMTPSARSRISTGSGAAADDPLERHLNALRESDRRGA